MRQTAFSFLKNYNRSFGGSLLHGKRKTKRPLSTKHPIHLIIKSCHKGVFAPGNRSLEKLIYETASKFNIKIYDLALNWSHIHFLIRIRAPRDYNAFIRSLTSVISLRIRKIKPDFEKIFTLRPFTRVLSWGKDFKKVFAYLVLNQLEASGFIRRNKPTKIKSKSRLNKAASKK